MPQGVGYPGVQEAVAALVGKPSIDAAANSAAQQRLLQAQNQRALLDKRVADAVIAAEKAASRQSLRQNEPAGRDLDLLLGELGGQFSSIQTGLGAEQQNLARGQAAATIDPTKMDETDLFNALIGVAGDKMLDPAKVQVQPQATADLAASKALEDQRRASAEKSRRTDTSDPKNKPFTLPDAARMKAVLNKNEVDEFGNLIETSSRIPQFIKWQAEQARLDPAYRDGEFALAMFEAGITAGREVNLSELGQRNLAASEALVPGKPKPQEGGDPNVLPSTPELGGEPPATTFSPADAQAVLDAAERAIQGGKDPNVVRRIAEQKLKEMGYAIGPQ